MPQSVYVVCPICNKELVLNRTNFKRIRNKETGKEHYSHICRDCEKQQLIDENWKDGKLLCHICGQYKDPSEFSIHPHYEYRQHRDKRCTKCKGEQNKRARQKYSDQITLEKVLQARWFGAKDRANSKNIPFTITKQDLLDIWNQQNGLCNISKIPMTYELDNGRIFTNVSLDQKNPGQGYTKDNIQLVCSAVNQLKSNWDMNTVLYICKQVVNNYEQL